MSTNAFNVFNLHSAAEVSRRASLRILGAVPLGAAFVGPLTSGAESSGKNAKKNVKKKVRQKAQQRCLAQVGQCGAFFVGRCESPDPSECEARIARCCEFLGSCDAASFLSCLLETS